MESARQDIKAKKRRCIADDLKRIQPKECQKYVRLVMDNKIASSQMGRELLVLLENASIKFVIRNLLEESCIFWERVCESPANENDEDDQFPSLHEISDGFWRMEDQLIRIYSVNDMETTSGGDTIIIQSVAKLKASYPTMSVTLIFPTLPAKSTDHVQREREAFVVDLQILHNCNVIQMKAHATDLMALLKRFTKAVAETPYKRKKAESQEGFKKFLLNDNKQCVRVTGTNGLTRLWQQHLNRLPLVTLDIAEAIRAQYSCPKKMLDDMKYNPDVVAKIADLRICRANEALDSNRRIGNVLSRKLIKLYESTNPDERL